MAVENGSAGVVVAAGCVEDVHCFGRFLSEESRWLASKLWYRTTAIAVCKRYSVMRARMWGLPDLREFCNGFQASRTVRNDASRSHRSRVRHVMGIANIASIARLSLQRMEHSAKSRCDYDAAASPTYNSTCSTLICRANVLPHDACAPKESLHFQLLLLSFCVIIWPLKLDSLSVFLPYRLFGACVASRVCREVQRTWCLWPCSCR